MVHWRDIWTGHAACFEESTELSTDPARVTCSECIRYLGRGDTTERRAPPRDGDRQRDSGAE